MIALIAFLTAACGFLNEMNIAQTLTAAMGGTALRYQLTFGIFTFSLGLGAWLYDRHYLQRFSVRAILIAAQSSMIVLSALSPYWISYFNPLLSPEHAAITSWLVYIPIFLTGLISGLELPALLELSRQLRRHEFSPLAWDYIGMFAASALFPIYLLYNAGVYGTALVAATLSLASLVLALALPITPRDPFRAKFVAPRTFRVRTLVGFIFLLSFCSFSYELILAKILGDIIHDETLAYSLGIGIMLIGLGFGTFCAGTKAAPIKTLIHVEFALVIMGGSLFAILYTLSTTVMALPVLETIANSKWLALLFFSPLPFAIGWLTGFELPLLLRTLSDTPSSLGLPLALNYIGALVSGFVVPLILLPQFTPAGSLGLIACLNFVLLCVLLLQQASVSQLIKCAYACIGATVLVMAPKINPSLEQLFLKTYYYNLSITEISPSSIKHFFAMASSISDVQREITPYQYIDKVQETNPKSYFARDGFILFLNKQQQIDSERWRTYHESFVLAPANLSASPQASVLICGGGDGVLARMLLENPKIQKITLVELDPRMIELSKTDSDVVRINNGALEDPRVHVITDDAFAFIHREQEKYDAIYIDFPYPDTFELSRLYSIEMYSAIRAKLNPGGFIILDAPIWRYVDKPQAGPLPELTVLLSTLQAAGFQSVFPFGTVEPFIFATVEKQNLSFDYTLLHQVSDSTFTNLASLEFLIWKDIDYGSYVNSIYKPQPFFKQ